MPRGVSVIVQRACRRRGAHRHGAAGDAQAARGQDPQRAAREHERAGVAEPHGAAGDRRRRFLRPRTSTAIRTAPRRASTRPPRGISVAAPIRRPPRRTRPRSGVADTTVRRASSSTTVTVASPSATGPGKNPQGDGRAAAGVEDDLEPLVGLGPEVVGDRHPELGGGVAGAEADHAPGTRDAADAPVVHRVADQRDRRPRDRDDGLAGGLAPPGRPRPTRAGWARRRGSEGACGARASGSSPYGDLDVAGGIVDGVVEDRDRPARRASRPARSAACRSRST